MKAVSMKAVIAAAFAALALAGCATSLDVGPGYYHYNVDSVAYRTAPAVVTTTPTVVTTSPTVVYREPTVVYSEPTVVYRTAPVF